MVLALAPPCFAAVPAGTVVANTATMRFGAGDAEQVVSSNTVTLITAEILDVANAADRATTAVAIDTVAVPFVVTNAGNGDEGFAVAVTSDRPGVAVDRIAIDSDGDGAFQPGSDPILAAGTALMLHPGAQARILVLVDGAQVTAATVVSATATAATGSGALGTVFAGAGTNGGDAVVGATGARATAATTLTPATTEPTIAKAQSVLAPDGSGRAVRGAIVTYTLVADLPAATRGVTVDDPVPAGTAYLPGSLSLDATPLTDADDGDAGAADATAIHVGLGTQPAARRHVIQFSVKIL